jgi:hypothetical protein
MKVREKKGGWSSSARFFAGCPAAKAKERSVWLSLPLVAAEALANAAPPFLSYFDSSLRSGLLC